MKRYSAVAGITLCTLATAGLLVYPLMVIQPFQSQTPTALQIALWMFNFAPWPTFAMAIASIGVAVFSWVRLRRGERAAAATMAVLTCLFAAAVRVNVFEILFHPAGEPKSLAIEKAKLDDQDMLVTVALGGDARAYPIREMGYHHVVNDLVGGVPIVVTY